MAARAVTTIHAFLQGTMGSLTGNIGSSSDPVSITVRNVQAPGEALPAGLAAGRYIRISIKDTGIGIPERYLPRIFDPYFTTKEKGSGLGLAAPTARQYANTRNADSRHVSQNPIRSVR